jgi:L-erythro-3,5-diaminohexanoate dehydrogenase
MTSGSPAPSGGPASVATFPSPQQLGAWRSLAPAGTLCYLAERLDAASPANEFEAELDVEMLNIDATSYRQIRLACDGDARAMEEMISGIVGSRGKMQNPHTGSGGVLAGRLVKAGDFFEASGIEAGQLVVPLVSLVSLPLSLESVGPLDPSEPQVPARGRAVATGLMSLAPVPEGMSLGLFLRAIDVYPAASHTRETAPPGGHVIVIGTGHAGLCALAAAREAVGEGGEVTVIDLDERALAVAGEVDPKAHRIEADARDPAGLAWRLSALGLRPADLTLLCTNVSGCEAAAILLTASSGTVMFFSTATTFAAAGLGADSLGSLARLVIPNGYTTDRGRYLVELIGRTPPLARALQLPSHGA